MQAMEGNSEVQALLGEQPAVKRSWHPSCEVIPDSATFTILMLDGGQQAKHAVEIVSGKVVEENLDFRHVQVPVLVLLADAGHQELHVQKCVTTRGASKVC